MAAIRPAVFAGRFYPGTRDGCQRMAAELFHAAAAPSAVGAIVPHAGWIYSGFAAALAIFGVAARKPETVIIFGAVHGPDSNPASVFTAGAWATPVGDLQVDEDLARRFTQDRRLVDAPAAHRHEHSIEVQLPLIRQVLPDVRIVPVGVRPGPDAAMIGQFCAAQALDLGRRVAFLGSTDLTHYGPAFGFESHGHGPEGIRWAKGVNDRRLVALIQALDAEAIVPEALVERNACGPGAVAATIGAVRQFGRVRYQELRHTCSAEVEGLDDRDPFNSVGYEAGVFIGAD